MSVEVVDDGGASITVLQLSATANHPIKTVRFLLGVTKVELHASLNVDGSTALDFVVHAPNTSSPPQTINHPLSSSSSPPMASNGMQAQAVTDATQSTNNNQPADHSSADANAMDVVLHVSNEPAASSSTQPPPPPEPPTRPPESPTNGTRQQQQQTEDPEDLWVKKMRGWLMVVAVLIASVTYQAALNPPGGLWQDNFPGTMSPVNLQDQNSPPPAPSERQGYYLDDWHTAGDPIKSQTDSRAYLIFTFCNNMALAQSLAIIMLLMRRTSFYGKHTFQALRVLVVGSIIALSLAATFPYQTPFPVTSMLFCSFILARFLIWLQSFWSRRVGPLATRVENSCRLIQVWNKYVSKYVLFLAAAGMVLMFVPFYNVYDDSSEWHMYCYLVFVVTVGALTWFHGD